MNRRVLTLHASAVAWQGRGVLIRGGAGRGKSGLALQLMAFGATLVADDRTNVAPGPRGLLAWAPPTILGVIEARGVGLLRARFAPPTPIALVVDLDEEPGARLPEPKDCDILGVTLPLINGRSNPYIAPAILQVLNGGIVLDR